MSDFEARDALLLTVSRIGLEWGKRVGANTDWLATQIAAVEALARVAAAHEPAGAEPPAAAWQPSGGLLDRAERIQSALRACNPPVLITDAQALLAARAAEA